MAAASNGHLEAATSLVKAGAALDKQNSDGHSALMFAYNGRAQVCMRCVYTTCVFGVCGTSGGGRAAALVKRMTIVLVCTYMLLIVLEFFFSFSDATARLLSCLLFARGGTCMLSWVHLSVAFSFLTGCFAFASEVVSCWNKRLVGKRSEEDSNGCGWRRRLDCFREGSTKKWPLAVLCFYFCMCFCIFFPRICKLTEGIYANFCRRLRLSWTSTRSTWTTPTTLRARAQT